MKAYSPAVYHTDDGFCALALTAEDAAAAFSASRFVKGHVSADQVVKLINPFTYRDLVRFWDECGELWKVVR